MLIANSIEEILQYKIKLNYYKIVLNQFFNKADDTD